MKKLKEIRLIFLALMIVCSLLSCTEEDEGCLDPDATNLDISADKNCCCSYPNLTLDMSYSYGADSIRFFFDSLYLSEQGDSLLFRDLRFYISDFVLFEGSDSLKILDSLSYNNNGYLRDDLVLIDPSRFVNQVGSRKGFGSYSRLKMTIGLRDSWLAVDSIEDNSSHPWLEDDFYLGNSHAVGVVSYDVINMDTMNFTHFLFSPFYGSISLGGSWELEQATDFVIQLNLDIEALTRGIDFANSGEEQIKSILETNFINAVSIQ
jgi:hypothetical protein